MAHTHSNSPAQFDELDPHGAGSHGQHASHVIVGPLTLTSVLGILLFLTLLTVGQARLEMFIAHEFNIAFPLWVNVVFCMAIATIKGLLVMAYFMQLRYDNPVNTIVMLFTFFAFALFVGFTALDLKNRDVVYEVKSAQVVRGGTGNGLAGKPPALAAADAHKEKLIAKLGAEKGLAEFERQKAEMTHKPGVHEKPDPAKAPSSAAASRGRSGLSGALDLAAPKDHDTDHKSTH